MCLLVFVNNNIVIEMALGIFFFIFSCYFLFILAAVAFMRFTQKKKPNKLKWNMRMLADM